MPVNSARRVSSAVGGPGLDSLWHVHNMQYILACYGSPFGTLAVSSGVLSGRGVYWIAWIICTLNMTGLSFWAFWHAALQSDVSGVATDVKLGHESGCHLVHRYRTFRDPMPHMSLRGKAISDLIVVSDNASSFLVFTQPVISLVDVRYLGDIGRHFLLCFG